MDLRVSGYGSGHMRDVVVVNTILNARDRQLFEGWLAWKNGNQALLPAWHRYKARAPYV